jgi:hypothetical protein
LKDPIDDFRLMIEAALETCLRRRKLVHRFYESKDSLHIAALGADSFDQSKREQHSGACKRLEDLEERVKESTQTLEEELRLFRAEKELELRGLVTEFVRIKRQTNEQMRVQWTQFLQKGGEAEQ